MAGRAEFYFDGTYYRKRVKLPDGRYKDVRARSREALRDKLYELERALRMGLVLDDKTTVAELLAQWFDHRKDGLSFSRQRDLANAINNHICPVLGAMRVRDVKPEHCQRVMAGLAGKSRSLQTKVLSVLKQGFDCAVENGLALRSPCVRLRAGGAAAKEKTPLTPDQCAALEAAVEGTRAKLFVLLGLYAGLRREEICGLRWCDVDLAGKAPSLTVNHAVRFENNQGIFPSPLKTKASHRTIPLPARLAQALREARADSGSVFVVPARDGGCASLQTVRNLMGLVKRRTVREDAPAAEGGRRPGPAVARTLDFKVTPHLLRHTYITRLCASGCDIKKIQYLAGHSDISMTLGIYSHVVGNAPDELIATVERAFSGQAPGQSAGDGPGKVLSING